jgi:hypothetical protein
MIYVEDPTHLSGDELVDYMGVGLHDATIRDLTLDSSGRLLVVRFWGFTGRSEERFSCDIRWEGLISAEIAFEGLPVYEVKAFRREDGLYISEIVLNGGDSSSIVSAGVSASNWSVFENDFQEEGLIMRLSFSA